MSLHFDDLGKMMWIYHVPENNKEHQVMGEWQRKMVVASSHDLVYTFSLSNLGNRSCISFIFSETTLGKTFTSIIQKSDGINSLWLPNKKMPCSPFCLFLFVCFYIYNSNELLWNKLSQNNWEIKIHNRK